MDIAITAIVIIFFILTLKFIMQKRSEKTKGKSVDLSLFDDEIKNLLLGNKSILYFYTPTCGACKSQAPIIDKLKEEVEFVGKIDLSKNRDASTEFGILGTPTTVIMKGNTVTEIFVGLKKYDFLKTKYEIV
jgi:thioredoxin